MRTAARADANQGEITGALRAVGASVQPLHSIGKGCPDLLVGWQGRNLLLELKDGAKVPSRRKLTEDEDAWHRAWGGQVAVVESVTDALRLLGFRDRETG